ncbi:MAG: ATP-binding protein [Proteobacteria bacterium]|nr:ATP-binding protein [Pseudomonadota bacterium]
MIDEVARNRLLDEVTVRLAESPVTILLGARQTGKTTLARMAARQRDLVRFFDLEVAADRMALAATPEKILSEATGLVVLDEVQRVPSLFEVLRPLADRPDVPARFLLLGSASPDLVRGTSETLAGRALVLHIPGFTLEEVGLQRQNDLWLRGAFPRSFLAADEAASLRWRESFIDSFLERDIPKLGIRTPAETLRRFWNMLCHFHGQIWNASELARSLAANEKTARHYLDILAGAYMVRVLPAWHENIGKRQVKSSKVYLRDSGLLHAMLDIRTRAQLESHPRYGASWEGFALEQTLARFGDRHAWFWATQRGAELDLMVLHEGRRIGFEFKCSDAPGMTRSLGIALTDLKLDRVFVVYPGTTGYPLSDRVEVIPLSEIPTLKP